MDDLQYLDKNNLIPDNHHGSRPGRSTTTALLDIYEKAIENYEKGMSTAILTLDQSAAYEIIDHRVLIQGSVSSCLLYMIFQCCKYIFSICLLHIFNNMDAKKNYFLP